MKKGLIWMLHSVEDDSPRTERCEIFRNLTVSPAVLERRIAEARADGWTFVSGAKFLADKRDGAEHRNILVTIDDGFRNIYENAFPLFRRLGVPFVFYVATGIVENGFRICRYAQLDGMIMAIDLAVERGMDPDLCLRRYRRLKRWFPFVDGRRVMEWIFGKGLDFDCFFREAVVSPGELKEMAESGLCEVGSHTVSHVHVERCRRLERELVASKSKIEEWTGRPCESFSFPYGHCSAKALELVRRHFAWATRDVREPPYETTDASDDHLLPRMIFVR
jgi:peptidoglycan/xylan/chitin deacetylase (PgdA/CDA1 family)